METGFNCSLNGNMAKKSSLGQAAGSSVSTLDQLKAAILSIASNTNSYSISAGTIEVSSAIENGLPGGTWGLIIQKATNNTYVGGIAYNNSYAPYSINKSGDNWSFKELAVKNDKTFYYGTINSDYVSSKEGALTRCNNVISGYFIVTTNTATSANVTLISGFPRPMAHDTVQIPFIPLNSSDQYKCTRARITGTGELGTWYGLSLQANTSYLAIINYICDA